MAKILPGGGGSRLSKNRIKYTLSLVITIIGLLSLFVGTSYAILKGTDTTDSEQVIKTGSVKLKLTEKFESIDKKITVMSDVDGLVQDTTYDFNLKNIGSEPAKFDIKLVNDVPSNYTGEVLSPNYFKLGLEINGEEHGPMSLEDVEGVIDSDIIYKNELINYKLRIWLDEEKSEELKTKEDYKAFLKLEVEAKQRVEEMDTLEKITTFTYTGDVQEYKVPRNGYYKIETWGAQGGSYSSSYIGGYGAYTKGEIYLETGEKLYIYVGGKGEDKSSGNGGYNGGANGVAVGSYKGYPGGGATDIRLVKGVWNDQKSLASRIMVAGAGGGAGYHTTPYYSPGGHAGGLTAYAGTSTHSDSNNLANAGGNQTRGGYNNYGSLGLGTAVSGGFGYGGAGTRGSTYGNSGGGSGYYGGSGGPEGLQPGGGGSSYISGHTGCVAIISQDNITPKSGCTTETNDKSCSIHYSNKKFINTVMIDGSGYLWNDTKTDRVNMPNPTEKNSTYEKGKGNIGNGYAIITFIGEKDLEKYFGYTKEEQEYTVPKDGYYYIELAGAGKNNTNIQTGDDGLGGKTSGYTYLKAGEKLYFYVGGQGNTFNGGGTSTVKARIGGGATDVRLVSGSWNDTKSLISRIMVAGGAGGNSLDTNGSFAGDGGTLIGENGFAHTSVGNTYSGLGGTQISSSANTNGGSAGGFGYGGSSAAYTDGHVGGSGGGGYYGGSGAKWHSGAGGGSSYISGYAGVNSVEESTTITHTNQTLHYSGKYFIGGKMLSGVNKGNGYAKIKYVGNKPKRKTKELNNVRYIKDCTNNRIGNACVNCRNWTEIQAIKDGINIAKGKKPASDIATDSDFTATAGNPITNITDGKIDLGTVNNQYQGTQCITIDLEEKYNLDEVAVWHSVGPWLFLNHSLSVSEDGTTWTKVISGVKVEDSNGKRTNAYEEKFNGYVEDGLILWYDAYNNGSGDSGNVHSQTATTWKNLISSSYTGTLSGPIWHKNYLYFDGSDDWVGITQLNLEPITLEIVFSYPTITTTSQHVLSNAQEGGYSIYMSADGYAKTYYEINNAYREITQKSKPVINKPRTYSSSYDKNDILFFIDGELESQLNFPGTIGLPNNNTITAIGTNPNRAVATAEYFKGNIYSVRIYNKALTDEEIKHNYLYDKERFNLE